MGAHNSAEDLYKVLAEKGNRLPDVTASTTLNLGGRTFVNVTVTATCTVTLPSIARGLVVLILCDDTSTVTIADASGTIGSFTGTSGTTGALCFSTDDNSWACLVAPTPDTGTAENITILDSGEYFPGGTVELGLAHLAAFPNAKNTVNSAADPVVAAAGDLTGARHVFWTNTTDGAIGLTTRTGTEMFADSTAHFEAFTYLLTFANTGDGTLTLTGGSNVTIAAAHDEVATLTTRTFLVSFSGTDPTEVTLTCVSKGTIEAT
jgi:hypothetical protein